MSASLLFGYGIMLGLLIGAGSMLLAGGNYVIGAILFAGAWLVAAGLRYELRQHIGEDKQ